jgi:hypothetical protein
MKIETELLKNIEEKTMTKYDSYILGDTKISLIDGRQVESMFEDLIHEIEKLEKEIDYMREDVRENYKRIPVENQYE